MKQDYTLDELQTEMTALAQLFDSVTLADPRMGLLDPATLQPLNKVAAMPALDAAGRGLKIEKAADGLRTVIAQGITVADTPCVLLLGMPLPRSRKVAPCWVPSGMVYCTLPSMVGTVSCAPSAAWVKEMGISR